jgi:hypothetical protein
MIDLATMSHETHEHTKPRKHETTKRTKTILVVSFRGFVMWTQCCFGSGTIGTVYTFFSDA